MNSFDFTLYDPEDSSPSLEQEKPKKSTIPKVENSSFDFSAYDPEDNAEQPKQKSSNASINKSIIRYGGRSLSRAAETAVGLPGDLINLIKTGLTYGLTKATGADPEDISKLMNRRQLLTPPTSSDLKSLSEETTKGFTKPENKLEEFSDNVISDLTSLAVPIKGRVPFLRALGTSLGANVAKEGVGYVGGSEGAQEATKLGALFLTGLAAGKSADKLKNNLYEKSRDSIPKGTMIDTVVLGSKLNAVKNQISKGISTPTKTTVLKSIKDIEKKAKGGAMEFEDLVQAHHDLNEISADKKLFEELSKPHQKLLKARLDKVKNVTGETINEKGAAIPGFLENWKNANEAHGAIVKSHKFRNTIKKLTKAKSSYLTTPALILLEALNPGSMLYVAGSVGAGLSAMKSGELISKFYNSPVLRKHYVELLKNAADENVKATIQSISKINRELKNNPDHQSQPKK